MVASILLGFLLFAQSAGDALTRANRLLQAADVAGAERAVDEALALNPRLAPALVLKAKIATMGDRLDEAERLMSEALAIERAPSSYFVLGFVLYSKNDFVGARKALASGDRKDPRVLFYQALTEEGLNEVPKAVAFYKEAIRLGGNLVEARVAYARLLFEMGQLNEGEAMVDGALKIAPGDPAALHEKSRGRFEQRDFAGAVRYGEEALKGALGTPLERRVRYVLVRAYQSKGDAGMAGKHRAIFEQLPMPLVR